MTRSPHAQPAGPSPTRFFEMDGAPGQSRLGPGGMGEQRLARECASTDTGRRVCPSHPRERLARLVLSLLIAIASAIAAGCVTEGERKDRADTSVTKTARKEPVRLSLLADQTDLPLDERLTLTIEGEAEPGVTIELDDYEAALGGQPFEYRASEAREGPARRVDDRIVRAWVFEVEFFLPGEYEMPGAAITFWDERADGDAGDKTLSLKPEEQTLRTEPIQIVVRSESEEALPPEQLAKIETLAPVELAPEPGMIRRHPWLAAGVAVVCLALLGLLLRRLVRLRRETEMPPIPADQWARAQLAALVAEDLLTVGRFREFFYRVSGILREYIERRFRLSAPEMTSEEFLVALASDRRFDEEHRAGLLRFTQTCDRVKYALHEPTTDEADTVLRAAGEFVEQTGRREQETEEPAGDPADLPGERAA
jgi:hypothetical protein